MKWIRSLLIYTAIIFCLFPVILSAQMTGTTYAVSTGSVVGGGGTANSSSYMLTGSAPLVGSVNLSSLSYTSLAGPTGITYGGMTTLRTLYDGNNSAVVEKIGRTLKVAYFGSSGDASGTIYYRPGGNLAFQSAAMTAGTGDTLVYNLSADLLTIRGFEYYFEVTRGIYLSRVGSSASPLVFRVSLTNEQAQVPDATPVKEYRIIGLPLSITGQSNVGAVFEDDLGEFNTSQWRIGRYNAATGNVDESSTATDVAPGLGYWLITAEAQTFGAAGISVRPNRDVGGVRYLEIPLEEGWNQLANPFGFRIAWNEILFEVGGTVHSHPVPNTVIEDSAYSYNGSGYETYNAIPPWEGVFVLANQADVTALMPYRITTVAPKVVPLKEQPLYSDMFWNIDVQLETDRFSDKGNFIGVRPDALKGRDSYDFSEPPAAPEAPSLAFRLQEEYDRLLRSDYRPPFTDGAVWEINITKAPGRKITFAGLENIPDNLEAWMVTDDGNKYALSTVESINISDKVSEAKLIIGNRTFTENEIASILPKTFTLEQNYPNPFNPHTSIRFALPNNGFTTLEIYNVLGQKVKTLVEKDLPAGYHTVVWNGDNSNGEGSASGIYFYRLKSGDNSLFKKMLLIK